MKDRVEYHIALRLSQSRPAQGNGLWEWTTGAWRAIKWAWIEAAVADGPAVTAKGCDGGIEWCHDA